jgi:hypothetical protein
MKKTIIITNGTHKILTSQEFRRKTAKVWVNVRWRPSSVVEHDSSESMARKGEGGGGGLRSLLVKKSQF